MKNEKTLPKSDLLTIPGVGPSIAQDLLDVGFRRVSDLRRKNPDAIYEAVCALRGQPQAPAVSSMSSAARCTTRAPSATRRS